MKSNEEDPEGPLPKEDPSQEPNGTPGQHEGEPKRNHLVLVWLGGILAICVAATAGFLIGWFTAGIKVQSSQQEIIVHNNHSQDWKQDFDPVISQQLKEHISPASIEENLKWLTAMPRLAGTPADELQAKAIKQIWRSQGLDTAGVESYEVLLSYPGNRSYPNTVQILSEEGEVVYEAPWEKEDDRIFNIPDFQPHTPPYGAYCGSAVVQGDLVYANYADQRDLEILRNNSVDLKGKILLVKSTWTSLYNMAKNAAEAGAVAVLVFPDPYTDAPLGGDDVFPKNWWLPRDGVRRGAVKDHMGDTLTPDYAAKEFAFREPLSEAKKMLCPLPLQPISYAVADDLLSHVDESTPLLPDAWTYHFPVTGLSNKHHRLGGVMKSNRKVRVEINNKLEKRRIYNAFGMVIGELEPDRLVIIGGHRDAWGHGAMDPGGGTAVLLEVSAAIGKQIKFGWRPRRTLIFASWGAEEFGLIGSTEWVQERLGLLTHKAISYINLDVVVTGHDHVVASSSPLLAPLVLEITRQVSHPHFPTLFEAWQNYTHSRSMAQQEPRVDILEPNSDFVPFFYLAGIPSVDVHISGSKLIYPAYHTQYDTFDYVSKHVDPGFVYHGVMAELFTRLLYRVGDSFILPFDVRNYGNTVQDTFKKFAKIVASSESLKPAISEERISQLGYCVFNFTYALDAFANRLETTEITSPYQQRQINDQLMLLERAFIDNIWDTEKHSVYKHVLHSPQKSSCFYITFPGINDALCKKEILEFEAGDVISLETKQEIHKQFATVCHALNRAVDMITI